MPGEVGTGDRPCAVKLDDVIDGRIETRCSQGQGRHLGRGLRRWPIHHDRVLDRAVDLGRLGDRRADGRRLGRRPAASEEGVVVP